MTDVNIATQIISDAYQDRFDMAMLISGDSDLVPPIKAIHENFKQKRVFVRYDHNVHDRKMGGYFQESHLQNITKQIEEITRRKNTFISEARQ